MKKQDKPTPPSEEDPIIRDNKGEAIGIDRSKYPAPTEKECCALCSKETLYDDTNAPDCTDPNCPCHSRPEEKLLELVDNPDTIRTAAELGAQDQNNNLPRPEESWEEEFDNLFTERHPSDSGLGGNYPSEPVYQISEPDPNEIKSFIRQTIEKDRSRIREEGIEEGRREIAERMTELITSAKTPSHLKDELFKLLGLGLAQHIKAKAKTDVAVLKEGDLRDRESVEILENGFDTPYTDKDQRK